MLHVHDNTEPLEAQQLLTDLLETFVEFLRSRYRAEHGSKAPPDWFICGKVNWVPFTEMLALVTKQATVW